MADATKTGLVAVETAKLVETAPDEAMVARAENPTDTMIQYDTRLGAPVYMGHAINPGAVTSGDIAATGKTAEQLEAEGKREPAPSPFPDADEPVKHSRKHKAD